MTKMTKRKPDKSNNGIDLTADGIDRGKKNIFYDLTDRATDSLTNGIRSQKIGMPVPPGTCPGWQDGKPVSSEGWRPCLWKKEGENGPGGSYDRGCGFPSDCVSIYYSWAVTGRSLIFLHPARQTVSAFGIS